MASVRAPSAVRAARRPLNSAITPPSTAEIRIGSPRKPRPARNRFEFSEVSNAKMKPNATTTTMRTIPTASQRPVRPFGSSRK